MAEFDADKLGARLDQLNRGELETMQKLVEELLNEMSENKPVPKRVNQMSTLPKNRTKTGQYTAGRWHIHSQYKDKNTHHAHYSSDVARDYFSVINGHVCPGLHLDGICESTGFFQRQLP